ncbi:MAG: BrnT family toxin [Sphingobium sp.]
MNIFYDPVKRALTLERRGLDFADAAQILNGDQVTLEDDRQDYGEIRYNSFGFLNGRLVALTWTPREDGVRVISLRKANDREQAWYRRIVDRPG